jgi:hypothetical protein
VSLKEHKEREDLGLDEVLDMLEKTSKRIQKALDEGKESATKQTEAYEQMLRSKDVSEEQKLKAFIGRALEFDRLERLSSQLSLLYTLQIFAFKVKVLEISVCKTSEQLARAGVLEKNNEIDDVKKHIEALKILVEAQYESLKDIKDQSKDLAYIF